ncbi:hypothetical protein Aduo_000878 [Ancylostoma duodenale]
MPADIKTMKDYAFFFRLSTLLELLMGQCLQRISQDDLRTWTGKILSIATAVFDSTSWSGFRHNQNEESCLHNGG